MTHHDLLTDPSTATPPQGMPPAPPRRSRLKRRRVAIASCLVGFWLLIVLAGTHLTPYDVFASSGPRLSAPSFDHWLGTDSLGRDVLTRTMAGARHTIPVALAAVVAAAALGSLLGGVAGFLGSWADAIIMRAADVTMAFPAILLAMAVAAALGPGLTNSAIAIVIVWWPFYARIARGQVLTIKQFEHVESSTAIGSGRWRTLRKHIAPHAVTPVLVNATMDLGQIILLVASLSFLGLGALPPSPEWGAMITDGAKNFYQPWIAAAPGVAMLTVTMTVNFMGDWLRDALDVKSHR